MKTHLRNKLRDDDDFNPDEMAEKELSGMAHSFIGEEKAEMASNKPELDLKVVADENSN